MLEGTIKLHGQQGSGKTRLLMAIEEVLSRPEFTDFRIVCKTQQSGSPEQHEVTFAKPSTDPKATPPAVPRLRSNWTGR